MILSRIFSRKFFFETVGFAVTVAAVFYGLFWYIGYLKNEQAGNVPASLQEVPMHPAKDSAAALPLAPPTEISKGARRAASKPKAVTKKQASTAPVPVVYSVAAKETTADSLAKVEAWRQKVAAKKEAAKKEAAAKKKKAAQRASRKEQAEKKLAAKRAHENIQKMLVATAEKEAAAKRPTNEKERVQAISRLKVVHLLMGKW